MPRTNVVGTTPPPGSGAQRCAQAGEREHSTDSTAGWSSPGWRDAAVEYHAERGRRRTIGVIEPERLLRLRQLLEDDGISFGRAHREVNAARLSGRAAVSTVEALMFSLRRGVEALTDTDAQHRLSELSEEQLRTVCERLQNFKVNIAPAWTHEDVGALISIWSTIHASK
jgi:hypothetical protein